MFSNKHIYLLTSFLLRSEDADSADEHNFCFAIMLNHISPSGLFTLGNAVLSENEKGIVH